MRNIVSSLRQWKRFAHMLVRTRSLTWAQIALSSNCAPPDIERHPSGKGIWLPYLSVGVQVPSNRFLLDGYWHAKRLRNVGAAFQGSNNSGVTISIGSISVAAKTWEDLFILYEIHVEGSYRIITNSPAIIFDVGCNVGHAGLYLASCYPCAEVIAFEPVTETYERALANIEMNPHLRDRIRVFNFGWASRDDTAEVEYSDTVPGRVGVYALPHDGVGTSAARRTIFLRDCAAVVSDLIKTGRQGPVLLKIDCEGSEYSVLKRLAETGRLDHFDYVVMEWHRRIESQRPTDLCSIFRENGFVVVLLGDTTETCGMLYAIRTTSGFATGVRRNAVSTAEAARE